MKCKTCEGEVPPKFAHAILVNICPLCGNEIMDVELQTALKEIKTAMGALESYPQEIFDWLKSNYNLYSLQDVEAKVKETEDRLGESHRKILESARSPVATSGRVTTEKMAQAQVELDKDGNQIAGDSLQSSAQTNKFFRHSERTLNNQDHIKKMISQIKKSGSPTLLDEEGGSGVITPDMVEAMGAIDSEDMAELHAAFGTDVNNISSGLDGDSSDYEDEIPSIVMNMANKASGGQGMNQRDLAKLQNLQNKSAHAKREISKTGSVGLIRR